jgi:GNAT superfamily N-acetyltransferase
MPANNADFHNITISHVDNGKRTDLFVNANHPDEGIIGQLHLGFVRQNGRRKVRNIFVKKEHQRKGIATAMWNYAEANGFKPQHSDDRTDAGEAWARSLGKRLPPRYDGLI